MLDKPASLAFVSSSEDGKRLELRSAVAMPNASSFLWNPRMLLQLNCRGYAVAQHMQPEPGKYSHGPALEAKTFMQPEHPYYAHHPGRFCYVRDDDTGRIFSAPHEPVRARDSEFLFSAGLGDAFWRVRNDEIEITMSVRLPHDDVVELWDIQIQNIGQRRRRISIYPYFTIGYMSWLNQSAAYRPELGAIVACSVTPYQKLEDYPRIKSLKDCTYLLHERAPLAFETSRDAFEGEGGLMQPDALLEDTLADGDALYETPVAVLQYAMTLAPGDRETFRFAFGPADTDDDVHRVRRAYLHAEGFARAQAGYAQFQQAARGCLTTQTRDRSFDNFVNHWLPRQVFYHTRAHRLTTDPQTRNFLQDGMGSVYVAPDAARLSLIRALTQQNINGSMPEGILLNGATALKYINQVPHTDHCVWLPILVRSYLNETGDLDVLHETINGRADQRAQSVLERVTDAMHFQLQWRDARNLSLIAQGDWCDPMNMVGHRGQGVSGWLTMAAIYAAREWADICDLGGREDVARAMRQEADLMAHAAHEHLWDGDWFARGITDDGKPFGTRADTEGRIFLNPQSWAMLAGIASTDQLQRMLRAIDEQLLTPYGVMVLAPAYTGMREDIGRLTQKHPGSAENGAIYNHAAMFLAHALYRIHEPERAFQVLRRAIPGPDESDLLRRGQLPNFVPNYYRGAVHQFPRTAGRSSQMFNTGAASWLYRIVIEELFGLHGNPQGLRVRPQLPQAWSGARVTRRFRGAEFVVAIERVDGLTDVQVRVDGRALVGDCIRDVRPGARYAVDVQLPANAPTR